MSTQYTIWGGQLKNLNFLSFQHAWLGLRGFGWLWKGLEHGEKPTSGHFMCLCEPSLHRLLLPPRTPLTSPPPPSCPADPSLFKHTVRPLRAAASRATGTPPVVSRAPGRPPGAFCATGTPPVVCSATGTCRATGTPTEQKQHRKRGGQFLSEALRQRGGTSMF